jgi:hypothetical protein
MKGLIDPAADVGSCVEASLSRAKDGNAHGKSNQQVPNWCAPRLTGQVAVCAKH